MRTAGLLLTAIVPAFAGACLDALPDQPPFAPMCETNADCEAANGESCDQGICWGDPPDEATFAAVLVPPEGNTELARTDVGMLTIARDGSISDMWFAPTITISGRVLLACDANETACDPTISVAAQIRVRRRSNIPGGPEYSRTFEAKLGEGPGGTAFSMRLPRLMPGDEPYDVHVVPSAATGETVAGPSPAELAPPLRFTLDGDRDELDAEWMLAVPEETKLVTGRVVDAADRGVPGIQVFALGRWNPDGVLERASSLAITDAEGYFVLRATRGMQELYDLVATPTPGIIAPTLRALGVYIPDPIIIQTGDQPILVPDLRMPSYPQPASFTLPVKGSDTNGTEAIVAGAQVKLTTVLQDDGILVATYTAGGFTDTAGEVTLDLIPGGMENRPYLARVIPPPDSKHASIEGKAIDVGVGNASNRSVLSQVVLQGRSAVAGRLVSHDGAPVGGATVHVKASLAFKLAEVLGVQTELEALQFPSATTDGDGNFVVWIDPLLLGRTPLYDLEFAPPASAAAPRWSLHDMTVDDLVAAGGKDVPLPPPAFARGRIKAPTGETVEGAELWIYQIRDDDGICANAMLPAGDECEPPALLRGLWQSRDDGIVWVVLPDPDEYAFDL